MGSIYSELPRWKSHKIVRAAQILEIEIQAANAWRVNLDIGTAPGASQPSTLGTLLHRDAVASKQPSVGDYFVLYEDGYKSWSPKAAFEEGYARL